MLNALRAEFHFFLVYFMNGSVCHEYRLLQLVEEYFEVKCDRHHAEMSPKVCCFHSFTASWKLLGQCWMRLLYATFPSNLYIKFYIHWYCIIV